MCRRHARPGVCCFCLLLYVYSATSSFLQTRRHAITVDAITVDALTVVVATDFEKQHYTRNLHADS
jgi:hypothetical protein